MITKVKYTNAECTQVKATLEDGKEFHCALEGSTWFHTDLREWLKTNTPEVFKTEQELFDDKAAEVRAQRDSLIAASDWTVLPDVVLPAAEKASWITYRQALRDITSQKGFPFDVVFPVRG